MDTQQMIAIWKVGRTRLTNQLPGIAAADLPRTLHPESNSIGWLLRHIAEVELLFAKNIFGLPLQVKLQTVGKNVYDRGNFTDLAELLAFLNESVGALESAIAKQNAADWGTSVTTAEFGTITRTEALARVTTHTAWHAGQLAIIKKYGGKA